MKGIKLWLRAQGEDRWKLFRLGPDGHSILRSGDEPQTVGPLATDLREWRGNACLQALASLLVAGATDCRDFVMYW